MPAPSTTLRAGSLVALVVIPVLVLLTGGVASAAPAGTGPVADGAASTDPVATLLLVGFAAVAAAGAGVAVWRTRRYPGGDHQRDAVLPEAPEATRPVATRTLRTSGADLRRPAGSNRLHPDEAARRQPATTCTGTGAIRVPAPRAPADDAPCLRPRP